MKSPDWFGAFLWVTEFEIVLRYTENRATIEFKSTANRDNSWLAALA